MPSGPLDDHDAEDPIAIPYTALSADALQGVIESFVLREGTDYGEREFSLQQKIAHVLAQLHSGEAQIWFDPESQSLHIARSKHGVGAIGS